ncbi:hypothetical protein [Acinetobacter wuhouensis]|nr:hypothetical protein [Acinetobacter wuhouensis]
MVGMDHKRIKRNLIMINNFVFLNLLGIIFLFSQQSFAKTDAFKVYQQCPDDSGFHCDVIREVDGKKEIYFKDVKESWIEQVNQDYFKVKSSCGSPCQVTNFIGRNSKQDDVTDEFVAIDPKTNCLIETRKNKLTARQLKSNKVNILAKLNSEIFKKIDIYSFAPYRDFQRKSYFNEKGSLILNYGYDETDTQFVQKFINPCKS